MNLTKSLLYRNVSCIRLVQGQFRRIAFLSILNLLKSVETIETRKRICFGSEFVKTEPMSLNKSQMCNEMHEEIRQQSKGLANEFSAFKPIHKELEFLLPTLRQTQSSAKDLLEVYFCILDVLKPWLSFRNNEAPSHFSVMADRDSVFVREITSDNYDGSEEVNQDRLKSSVRHFYKLLREQTRKPTKHEFTAIQIHDGLIHEFIPVEYSCQMLSVPGFGSVQTRPSITDPGEGLIDVCTNLEWMRGIILHIEHLERGKTTRKRVEPYRISDPIVVAKVLSRVGADAPCTTYIGRPVFEGGDVKSGFLKAVRTIASACIAMFKQGVAECKIAMEGMTATETIEFMRCIRAATRRNRHTQILSAAFNIHIPILDDREETQQKHDEPVLVETKFQVAQLAIQLTKAGGFDKVTWDASSDSYPSSCILDQFTYPQAVELPHRAHDLGLLCYFSAGFKFHHLPRVFHTGVDGVGLGGAQILRYMDSSTGFHGPFIAENIEEILRIRDESASDWLGQSVILLARLDRMFYERSLTTQDDLLRSKLFEAICNQDEQACAILLDRLSHICNLPPDQDHPLIEWAKRLLNAENPLLAENKTAEEWVACLDVLQKGVENRDVDLLAYELGVS